MEREEATALTGPLCDARLPPACPGAQEKADRKKADLSGSVGGAHFSPLSLYPLQQFSSELPIKC